MVVSLLDTVNTLVNASVKESTARAYKTKFDLWLKFCKQSGLEAFPATEEKIILFMAHRFANDKVVYRTAASDLAGISHHFTRLGVPWPDCSKFRRLDLVKKGYKQLRSQEKPKKHFEWKHLVCYFDAVEPVSLVMNVCLKKTVLITAFRAMLRVSEYSFTPGRADQFPLRITDVRFDYTEMGVVKAVEITLQNTKTSGALGRVQRAAFHCECHIGLCLLHCLYFYIRKFRHGAMGTEQLFVFEGGAPLSHFDVQQLVKEVCRVCELDPSEYASHSLRKGGATDLYVRGVDPELIQDTGRWSKKGRTLQTHYLKPSPMDVARLRKKSMNKK